MTTSVSDRDFTERLIEEVKRHPALYNTREAGYKDRFKVGVEWQAVASCLGCTADSAKKRWQNLRGSYSRSRCNQNQPNGSGAPAEKKPQFYLAHLMSFLEPHMQHGPMQGNLGASKPEPLWEEDASGSYSQDGLGRTTPSTSSPCPSPPADEPESETQEPVPEPVIVHATSASVKQRKRAAPAMDNDDLFKEKAARFLEAKMQAHENNYKEDIESLRGLLPHMATLSRRRKITYLRKIYDLLFEMVEEEENETAVYN
ncbi:uncharacterized protein LOC101863291 [Aplysia californica]|uniref:Uncharacterized protein LOC101863291 n=1 Tax=Aplysia californica TaxID=6500 RepID=A0ABM1VZS8_APLCA|nr:uncharacterized protein LOC101863291 [Aplysia californica]